MEIKAFARNVRMSPRKVRLVTNLVKGMPVGIAIEQLLFLKKDAAVAVRKSIESAIANAVHNAKLNKDDLFIKTLTSDGGPTLKRWRARARGSAATIRKRTTHIAIVLSDGGKSEQEKLEIRKEKRVEKKEDEVKSIENKKEFKKETKIVKAKTIPIKEKSV